MAGKRRKAAVARVVVAKLRDESTYAIPNEWRWYKMIKPANVRIGYTVDPLVVSDIHVGVGTGIGLLTVLAVEHTGWYGVAVQTDYGVTLYTLAFKRRKDAKAKAVELWGKYSKRTRKVREVRDVKTVKAAVCKHNSSGIS